MKKSILTLVGCSIALLSFAAFPVHAKDITSPSDTFSVSKKEKSEINNDFYNWADQRAKMGNMAISKYYFDHGPENNGNLWYASTPDGDILVRNASDTYSSKKYNLRKIGGFVFYTAKDGTTGKCDNIKKDTDDGAEYSSDQIDITKPVDKYLLANNGIVYECKLDGEAAEPDSGFKIKGEDNIGSDDWIVSQDKAAQDEYRQLITKYTGNNVSTAINYNNSATQSSDVDSTTPAQSDTDTDDGMDHTAQTGKVIGDAKTHIYHTEDQHDYKINPKNEVVFDNEQQAIDAGYRKALR